MSVTVDAATDPRLADLTFARTVDRDLLHRHALSEVFLTDSRGLGAGAYLAAAQLPPSHAYYTDHADAGTIDPLLLLECARQAETYGAHAYFGVDRDTRFVLRHWSVRLDRPAARPASPAELGMEVRTGRARALRGSLRALTYEIGLFLADRPAGEVRIQVAYLPAESYRAVRTRRRAGTTPPTSAELRLPAGPPAVAPHRVGRALPANVVLHEPVWDTDVVEAAVRVPLDNPSMFDHPQDHLPGMVLMEAGRQLGTLVARADHGAPPHAVSLTGIDASFTHYAELDEPTTVRLHRDFQAPAGPFTVLHRDRFTSRVTFHQRAETIAEATLTFAVDGRAR